MSTIAAPEVEIIEHLDFPTLCGHSWHDQFHVADQPAKYIVRFSCAECSRSLDYPMCESGWAILLVCDKTRCLGCNAVTAPLNRTVNIIKVLS